MRVHGSEDLELLRGQCFLKQKSESESLSILSDFCDPMDYTVHIIFQAGMLEWVTFPFSRGFSQPRDQTQVSHITDRFFTS